MCLFYLLQIFSKVRLVDIALHSFLAKMSFGTWVETISLQVFLSGFFLLKFWWKLSVSNYLVEMSLENCC